MLAEGKSAAGASSRVWILWALPGSTPEGTLPKLADPTAPPAISVESPVFSGALRGRDGGRARFGRGRNGFDAPDETAFAFFPAAGLVRVSFLIDRGVSEGAADILTWGASCLPSGSVGTAGSGAGAGFGVVDATFLDAGLRRVDGTGFAAKPGTSFFLAGEISGPRVVNSVFRGAEMAFAVVGFLVLGWSGAAAKGAIGVANGSRTCLDLATLPLAAAVASRLIADLGTAGETSTFF